MGIKERIEQRFGFVFGVHRIHNFRHPGIGWCRDSAGRIVGLSGGWLRGVYVARWR